MNTPITVAYGDGIGPEIMDATLKILRYANAKITVETIEVGLKLYEKGITSGIADSAWESLIKNKVLLKSPITTPQGGGYKSLNVTMRKTLGLYANVRPCASYTPFVASNHPNMDVVIVRENEEDLYAGVEYRQTHNMCQTLKLISYAGSEKIIRYAFEYAVKNNRKKVTCFSKDNIMKLSDGTFHKIFNEVAKEYPNIENDHYIVDIGSARLASKPQIFDVIVTLNLYGDIISDIVAEVSGSVGLAGSANIGSNFAMFEAIHGSAPDIAGKNIANPSGLLHGAIMMLVHIGDFEAATKVHNAWLKTIEDGVHTIDIYREGTSKMKVGTQEFADEVIKRLGQQPTTFKPALYSKSDSTNVAKDPWHNINTSEVKRLVGVDVYFNIMAKEAQEIADKIQHLADGELKLQMISCRGLKVWPYGEIAINKGIGDHWRTRFVPNNTEKLTSHKEIVYLLNKFSEAGLDFIKTEHLYSFDDKPGFSLGQGE